MPCHGIIFCSEGLHSAKFRCLQSPSSCQPSANRRTTLSCFAAFDWTFAVGFRVVVVVGDVAGRGLSKPSCNGFPAVGEFFWMGEIISHSGCTKSWWWTFPQCALSLSLFVVQKASILPSSLVVCNLKKQTVSPKNFNRSVGRHYHWKIFFLAEPIFLHKVFAALKWNKIVFCVFERFPRDKKRIATYLRNKIQSCWTR